MIYITRNHQSYKKVSQIDISEIFDIHWRDVSGGVRRKTGSYCLYGYINYELAAKLVDCSGEHAFGDNMALVAIPAGLNSEGDNLTDFNKLLEEAGAKPVSKVSKNRPENGLPCTKFILEILDNNSGLMLRKDLRREVRNAGYLQQTFASAIYQLRRKGKADRDYDKEGNMLIRRK